MGFNLLEMVRERFTPGIVQQAGSMLGESGEGTQKAFGSAIPAVLGGLVQKGSTDEGADQLLSQLKDGGYTDASPDQISPSLSEPAGMQSLAERGKGLLGSFFGNRLEGVTNGISQFSGIRGSSALGIMGLIAPVAAGLLGKHVKENGIGASGLKGLLSGQSDTISKALPAGLGGVLGLGGASKLREVAPSVAETSREAGIGTKESIQRPADRTAVRAQKPRRSFAPMALVLAALVALVAWLFTRHRGEEDGRTQATYSQQRSTEAQGRTATPQRPAPRPRTDTAAPSAQSAGLQQFTSALDSNTGPLPQRFVLDGLDFDTNSANLTANGTQTADQLAATLKAHPNARIRVEGYTDATGAGSANTDLSQARASSVREELISKGIDGSRIEAKGSGASSPVAPNDTEAGRAQNRRTEVVLLSR